MCAVASLVRPPARSVLLRPADSLTILSMACSVGFRSGRFRPVVLAANVIRPMWIESTEDSVPASGAMESQAGVLHAERLDTAGVVQSSRRHIRRLRDKPSNVRTAGIIPPALAERVEDAEIRRGGGEGDWGNAGRGRAFGLR